MAEVFWQPWIGPTGTTGVQFLGVTGAVTGPAFFGITGATGPTGMVDEPDHVKYLYNRVRSELSGASDLLVRNTITDIMREFFTDSAVWTEIIPGLLLPNVYFYLIQPGQTQSVGDLEPAGKILRLVNLTDLNHYPLMAVMPQPPIMQLMYAPSNPQSVFVEVVKTIKTHHDMDLPHFPYWIMDTYGEYLIMGVEGRLQMQPDRPYSNPKIGMMNYQYFRQGVNAARVDAQRRHMQGGQAWAYPRNFRTDSQRGFVSTVGTSSQRF